MVAWGLVPAGVDLRRLFVDLMEEQVAAYYDPRGKVMVVGDWLPPDQQQTALLHELVHALQDRVIPLDDFIAPRPGEGDALLARQALLEGEAVGVTVELLLRSQGADFASLPDVAPMRSALVAASGAPVMQSAPPFLRDLLLFPYVDGLGFVHRFRRGAPWSAMTALYQDPPRSSAQILNPAKRLAAREDPIPVALPDLAAAAPGLTVVSEDELGEFALAAVMASRLGDGSGRAAAAGWRGDRYRVWEDGAGALSLAYVLVLDSDRAAGAFASSYRAALDRRYPAQAGRSAAPAATTWRTGGRAFAIEQRGAEVVVIEQMPEAAADAVREAIWRARPGAARP